MSTPPPDRPPTALFLRPHVFFPALIVLIAISVLLTPQAETSEGLPSLTSRSAAPNGAKGLAETARHLGWRVTERVEPFSNTMSPDAIYAVLAPSGALTEMETHTLLDRVRAGAAALVLLDGGAMADSLRLDRAQQRGELTRAPGDSVSCPAPPRTPTDIATQWPRIITRLPLVVATVRPTGPVSRDTVHIATVRQLVLRDSLHRDAQPAAIGTPLGRGRIVAIGDGRLLTNDVIRVCHWGAGVTAVRALEWLSERDNGGPRTTIVFDEFHQGYGRHASLMHAIGTWLGTTQSGRTTAQLAIAALLLLAASAPRPIAPLARTTIPRRSPLEHVAALAQAYEQVSATRTAARLLVQGLRRRAAPATGARRSTDEHFLAAVASRFPALSRDTERARYNDAAARELTNV